MRLVVTGRHVSPGLDSPRNLRADTSQFGVPPAYSAPSFRIQAWTARGKEGEENSTGVDEIHRNPLICKGQKIHQINRLPSLPSLRVSTTLPGIVRINIAETLSAKPCLPRPRRPYMRRIIVVALLLFAPLLAVAASSAPAVQSGIINYLTNAITLTGSNFEPGKTKPTVLFNGAALTVTSFSNTQIVATLPAGSRPGTFNLTVTNSSGNSVEFDMTYGAIGPQGPAGPAGPTGAKEPAGPTGPAGPQGPRGITGAPGAPGPAGANGVGFSFLNAFDPYATYAVNNVVTYNGSSYVAIVPNGPNPTGPTPDKNPSWSLMAAAGATGPAGPIGPQGPLGDPGPQGLMGNSGPQGPAGQTGPQGAAGGVLFSTYAQQVTNTVVTDAAFNPLVTVSLPGLGGYLVIGQVSLENDSASTVQVYCAAPWYSYATVPPGGRS